MKDGFVKAACATPAIKVADTVYNADRIIGLMAEAGKAGVKLLVFPELCLTGYTAGDLFLNKCLQKGVLEALKAVTAASAALNALVFIGMPIIRAGKLYNVAAVVSGGRILGFVPKRHIPNYSEFYEKRYFAEPDENGSVKLDGTEYPFGTDLIFTAEGVDNFTVAAEICEDMWVACPPSGSYAEAGAYIVVNLSASDEIIGKADYRRSLIETQSGRAMCAYLYADAGEGESSTDMVFAGHNIIAEGGYVLKESALFTTGLTVTELDLGRLASERAKLTSYREGRGKEYRYIPFDISIEETKLTRYISPYPFVPKTTGEKSSRAELILNLQAAGLATRLKHTGSKRAVLGVSGGLDSCLALIVSVKAMEILGRSPADVLAISMPGLGTTDKTYNNAKALTAALNAEYKEIDIKKAVKQHFLDIGQPEGVYDVTYENSQARERTQILMDMANKSNGIVIGTGDLSELALGFATYAGDHISMYAVNCSVPKTLIRHIIKYTADNSRNEYLKKVLYDILDTPVSPELLPPEGGNISQKTESIVGPYELHDFFLYYTVRWGFTPSKVYRLARYAFKDYSAEEILKWLKVFYKRFFAQQFKRSCLPDGPKIGSVTLSPRADWRMPSDASAALWMTEIEALEKKAHTT